MPSQGFAPLQWRRLALALPTATLWVFALAVAVGSYAFLPAGAFDWRRDIGPAARNWLHPGAEGLPLLPWAGLLLSPLGALPDRLASALVNGASVLVLARVVRWLGGPDWLVIPLLASPAGYALFQNAQTDALLLGGLLFFNGLDPLVYALKPQLAAGVLVSRLRRAGSRWPAYIAPLVLMLIVSFVVWPAWPRFVWETSQVIVPGRWNSSVWPWGLPIGLGLLWHAWKTGDDRWALAATPLLSPYVNWATWLGLSTVVAVRWPRLAVAVWLLFWAGLAAVTTLTLATGPVLVLGLAAALILLAAACALLILQARPAVAALQRRALLRHERAAP